jgi:hypothetical protein
MSRTRQADVAGLGAVAALGREKRQKKKQKQKKKGDSLRPRMKHRIRCHVDKNCHEPGAAGRMLVHEADKGRIVSADNTAT